MKRIAIENEFNKRQKQATQTIGMVWEQYASIINRLHCMKNLQIAAKFNRDADMALWCLFFTFHAVSFLGVSWLWIGNFSQSNYEFDFE